MKLSLAEGLTELLKCMEQLDGSVVFTVRVVPRASRSQIMGEHDGALRVRVAAPPVEGAANEELVRTISRALGVPSRAVEITGGHTSRLKQVRVASTSCAAIVGLAASA